MAASNYSVNIKLNTTAAKNDLQKLEARINKLRKNLNEPLKIDTRVSKIQEKIAKSKDAQKASMIETRNIGNQIQKAADQGLKVDKARAAIRKAASLDSKNQLKSAATQRKIALDELNLEKKITEEEAKQLKLQNKKKGGAGSSGGRSGVLSGALISGAFPLLFGQGPLAAAGGFGGGLLGGRIGGQMGGFAGGLIGTSIVTGIQGAVTGVANLGKALDPLTADLNKLSIAVGIVGTEEGRRIQLIEQLSGKQAALAAVTENMANIVGDKGVRELKEFGESFTALANSFQRFLLRVGATLAEVANRVSGVLPGVGPTTPDVTKAIQSDAIVKDLESRIQKAEAEILKEEMRILPKGFGGLFPTELPNVGELSESAIEQANLEKLRKQLDARKKTVKANEEAKVKAANNVKQADLLLKNNLDNITVLKDTLEVGKEEALVRQKIRELTKVIGEDEAKTQETRIRTNLTLERSLKLQLEFSQAIGQSFKDNFKDAITGAQSFGEAMRNVLNTINNKLIDMAIDQILFGRSSGGGGLFGSMFGGLFGGLFGGGPRMGGAGYFDPVTGLGTAGPNFGLADGGTARAGRTHLVGERGPELFTPRVTGTVIPNHALGGSTNIVVNVDASGSSVEGDEEQGRELGRMISVAIQSELIKQKRPGGMLA